MTAKITDATKIIDKTVFLRTAFHVLGNTKKVSNSVLASNNSANTRLVKIQKTLLESKELDAIRSADGQMRAYLYNVCLPYGDMGILLLSRELVDSVTDRCEAFIDERNELVNAFIEAYPALCDNAKNELEKLAHELGLSVELLYSAADYPSVQSLKSFFSFEYQYFSFSVPAGMNEETYQKEVSKAQAKIEQAVEGIVLALRENFFELVNHLQTALEPNADGKPKRLFASTVTNLQDFLDTFKARNVTNDADLDALVNEVQKIIHPNLSVDVIKKDESFKTSIHEKMEDISGKLSKLVEITPGRKFRGVD